jgi:ankyrin repeat protein
MPYEQLGNWKEVAETYLWLFRTMMTLPERDGVVVKATALLMECLRAVTEVTQLKKYQTEGPKESGVKELEQLKLDLESGLRDSSDDILAALMGLYKFQDRPWECSLVESPKPLGNQELMLKFTLLHRNARTGNHLGITEGNKDVNEEDILDWTPLHYAAAWGHEVIVDMLLDWGAEKGVKDGSGRTPLHLAAERGSKSVTKLLVDQEAEKDTKAEFGRTPLHLAAERGHEAVVELLLDGVAFLEAKDRMGWTPLHHAARNGHEAVVKMLLDKDKAASIESKDKVSWTPLHHAARNGHKPVIELLLDRGAAVNAKSRRGWTPLLHADKNGHEAIAKMLRNKGGIVLFEQVLKMRYIDPRVLMEILDATFGEGNYRVRVSIGTACHLLRCPTGHPS